MERAQLRQMGKNQVQQGLERTRCNRVRRGQVGQGWGGSGATRMRRLGATRLKSFVQKIIIVKIWKSVKQKIQQLR